MLHALNVPFTISIVLFTFASTSFGPTRPAIDHRRAKSVAIVDAQNRPRIRLFVDDSGVAKLQLIDIKGNVTASMHCAAEGIDSGLLVTNGRTSTTLAVDEKQAAIVAARSKVKGEPDATATMSVWNETTDGVDCVTRLGVSLPGGERFTQISVRGDGKVVTQGLRP